MLDQQREELRKQEQERRRREAVSERDWCPLGLESVHRGLSKKGCAWQFGFEAIFQSARNVSLCLSVTLGSGKCTSILQIRMALLFP